MASRVGIEKAVAIIDTIIHLLNELKKALVEEDPCPECGEENWVDVSGMGPKERMCRACEHVEIIDEGEDDGEVRDSKEREDPARGQ